MSTPAKPRPLCMDCTHFASKCLLKKPNVFYWPKDNFEPYGYQPATGRQRCFAARKKGEPMKFTNLKPGVGKMGMFKSRKGK